jgi:hypothetical protein
VTLHLDRDGFNPVMTAPDLKAFREKPPVDPQVRASVPSSAP